MARQYCLIPEHEAMLPAWRARWIANAMSTAPMTEADREACREAVLGMYAAAGRAPPKAIVFVPSPFVLRFAGGFASAIWHCAATLAATDDATHVATHDATHVATLAATRAATLAATRAATGDATHVATHVATHDATHVAARDATDAAMAAAAHDAMHVATHVAEENAVSGKFWYFFPVSITQIAEDLGIGRFGLECAQSAWRMWQGGNQWSAWDSFLSFFQDIARLDLPEYAAYQHWRTLSERSGPRIVHADFCMISDRPELLLVDDRNRPHCDTGPFCRWRDGSALYAVHGVRVPAWIIERPERLTVEAIDAEANAEVQRVMIERYGWDRYAAECGAEIVDHDERYGTLCRRNRGAAPTVFVRVTNRSPEPDGSFRHYVLPVHPECRPLPDPRRPDEDFGEPQALTALNAVASTFGMRGPEYARTLGAES